MTNYDYFNDLAFRDNLGQMHNSTRNWGIPRLTGELYD